MSYSPFRDRQSPFIPGLVVSPEQIRQDLIELAKISRCVRIYSVEYGLDKVPSLASALGLEVILGVWIGRDRQKNELLIDAAVSLANAYPGVITAMMVGSEVLLRGEMTAPDLRRTIGLVRGRVHIPVSYADVWEFWLRHREIGNDVDFVTVHILPYWEDHPVRAEEAAAHVDDIRKRMALAFPGKEILIGETGWPGRGRMRDGALPSRINQARFISDILGRARQQNFRVNLFEAYDEPWKRRWEGTVGGHWGLLDGEHRKPKYPEAAAISDYPLWKLQMGCGMAFSILVFGAAFFTLSRHLSSARLASWVAVAISATVGGALLGLAAEKALQESFGFEGWLVHGVLLAAALAAPLVSSNALMSKRALPGFVDLIGPDAPGARSLPMMVLGFVLIVVTLVAAETALSLVFDPRWRDFPYAGLTMAVVPFWTLAQLKPKESETQIAEAVFACLFAATALYILFNEGLRNWQALWTCAAFLVLGTTLWQPRAMASTVPIVLLKLGLFGRQGPILLKPAAGRRHDLSADQQAAFGPSRPDR